LGTTTGGSFFLKKKKKNKTQKKNKNKKTKVRAMPGNCPDRQTDIVNLIYKIG